MKYNELLRLLKQNGWFEVRQTGSHIIMQHPDKENQIVFPNHGAKEIGKGIQSKIFKQAGLKK